MTSVDSNFNFLCGRPHGAGPPLPSSTCVHLSLTPFPPPCGRHKWMAPMRIIFRVMGTMGQTTIVCCYWLRYGAVHKVRHARGVRGVKVCDGGRESRALTSHF